MTLAQILASVIFAVMFLLIVLEKFERQTTTLVCGALVMVLVFGLAMRSPQAMIDTLNVKEIFTVGFWYHGEGSSHGISWSTIFFIAGMMIMVEGMGKSGFFRWLCLSLAKAVNYRVVPLLVCFMCMSAVLAMFIDSITVVLFLATVTMELAQLLKFNPVPMVMAEIFCANLGGSATMCGDPPNIIIGTALGYTFFDFLTNTGLAALVSFVVLCPFLLLCFRKELKKSEANRSGDIVMPQPSSAITNKGAFTGSCLVFALAVVLLVTHAQTGLTVATIGVIAAILTLVVVAITAGVEELKPIMEGVDYKTLLFFIGLFVCVGGLEQTGVLEVLAQLIADVSGGQLTMVILIILWLSAIASAFVDNIPFAATMVPVIRAISETQGMALPTLAWSLALGTDLGGNATPIGASANVVGISTSAKWGHPISWGTYCKYCVPATILAVGICTAYLLVRYT